MEAKPPVLYITRPGYWANFWWLLWRACLAAHEDNCFGIAKGAAYSGLLSFFPVLTTMAALLVQARATPVTRVLSRLLSEVVPPGSESLVLDRFAQQGQRPVTLLVVATALSVWAASSMMMSLMEGFEAAYRIPTGRPFLQQRAMAILLVFSAALPVVGASALILFGARTEPGVLHRLGLLPAGRELSGWVVVLGRILRYSVALAAIVLVTWLLYYFGPNRRQRWSAMWPGAFLATVLWLISTSAFAWYVRNIANYNVMYGSIGAVIALLIWMYFLAVVALIGCEFNVAWERRAQLHLA
ncbi:MAG TPA: YihY/virulence factor BrkB family protein [Bryobacteraceae bacterium]|nr:YihY/virulence factor BrkB family protein [Bryobacteraceae bacterium]